MKKPSNVMKNKIYDKIAYALPKHQFGGQMLEYFKGLIPNLNRYQGQTNGVSNLYSDDAQAYYKNLLNTNQGLVDDRKMYTDKITPGFDSNMQWDDNAHNFYYNKSLNNKYTPTQLSTFGEIETNVKKNGLFDGIFGSELDDIKRAKAAVPGFADWYDGRKKYGDQAGQMYNSDVENSKKLAAVNDKIPNQILETGVNIYSLMQGQEAYDNKPKDNLTPRNTGHQGFRYAQYGGGTLDPGMLKMLAGSNDYKNALDRIKLGQTPTLNLRNPLGEMSFSNQVNQVATATPTTNSQQQIVNPFISSNASIVNPNSNGIYNIQTGGSELLIEPIVDTPLKKNGTKKVQEYQFKLREAGYNIKPDGLWGPETKAAYEAYTNKKSPTKKAINTGKAKVNSNIDNTTINNNIITDNDIVSQSVSPNNNNVSTSKAFVNPSTYSFLNNLKKDVTTPVINNQNYTVPNNISTNTSNYQLQVTDENPTNNSQGAAPISYFEQRGLPYQQTPDQTYLENMNFVNSNIGGSALSVWGAGVIPQIVNLPKVGKVIQYGSKYIDELGNYVSKSGSKLSKVPDGLWNKIKKFTENDWIEQSKNQVNYFKPLKQAKAVIETPVFANPVNPNIVRTAWSPVLKQFGGNVNLTGYTPGTSSYNNPFNIIPDGNITTMNTPFPIFAKPNNGPGRVLTPGNNYNFKGAEYVTEIPLKQYGGDTNTIDPNNPVKPVINSPQYGLSIVQKYNKLTDITQDQFEKLDFDQQKLLLNNAINEINLKNKKPVSGKVIYEEKTPMVVAKQSEQKTNKYNNRENDPNFINWYAKQKNDTIQVYVDPDTGEQSEIKINRNNISNNIKNKKTNSNKQRVVQLASAAFNKKYGGKVTYLF